MRMFNGFTETTSERMRSNELRIEQWMQAVNARVKRAEDEVQEGVQTVRELQK